MAAGAAVVGSRWPYGSRKETKRNMLDDKQKKTLETLTVEMLIALRNAYLREQGGRPPMTYWTQLQDRARSAARQSTSASEWSSLMQRRLQIGSLDKDSSRSLIELVRFCDEHQAHQEFLVAIERDHSLLMALTRLIVDERKQAQEEVTSA